MVDTVPPQWSGPSKGSAGHDMVPYVPVDIGDVRDFSNIIDYVLFHSFDLATTGVSDGYWIDSFRISF